MRKIVYIKQVVSLFLVLTLSAWNGAPVYALAPVGAANDDTGLELELTYLLMVADGMRSEGKFDEALEKYGDGMAFVQQEMVRLVEGSPPSSGTSPQFLRLEGLLEIIEKRMAETQAQQSAAGLDGRKVPDHPPGGAGPGESHVKAMLPPLEPAQIPVSLISPPLVDTLRSLDHNPVIALADLADAAGLSPQVWIDVLTQEADKLLPSINRLRALQGEPAITWVVPVSARPDETSYRSLPSSADVHDFDGSKEAAESIPIVVLSDNDREIFDQGDASELLQLGVRLEGVDVEGLRAAVQVPGTDGQDVGIFFPVRGTFAVGVLDALAVSEEPLDLASLQSQTLTGIDGEGLEPAVVNRSVDLLEQQGLVQKVRPIHPDGPTLFITTPEGQEVRALSAAIADLNLASTKGPASVLDGVRPDTFSSSLVESDVLAFIRRAQGPVSLSTLQSSVAVPVGVETGSIAVAADGLVNQGLVLRLETVSGDIAFAPASILGESAGLISLQDGQAALAAAEEKIGELRTLLAQPSVPAAQVIRDAETALIQADIARLFASDIDTSVRLRRLHEEATEVVVTATQSAAGFGEEVTVVSNAIVVLLEFGRQAAAERVIDLVTERALSSTPQASAAQDTLATLVSEDPSTEVRVLALESFIATVAQDERINEISVFVGSNQPALLRIEAVKLLAGELKQLNGSNESQRALPAALAPEIAEALTLDGIPPKTALLILDGLVKVFGHAPVSVDLTIFLAFEAEGAVRDRAILVLTELAAAPAIRTDVIELIQTLAELNFSGIGPRAKALLARIQAPTPESSNLQTAGAQVDGIPESVSTARAELRAAFLDLARKTQISLIRRWIALKRASQILQSGTGITDKSSDVVIYSASVPPEQRGLQMRLEGLFPGQFIRYQEGDLRVQLESLQGDERVGLVLSPRELREEGLAEQDLGTEVELYGVRVYVFRAISVVSDLEAVGKLMAAQNIKFITNPIVVAYLRMMMSINPLIAGRVPTLKAEERKFRHQLLSAWVIDRRA